MDIVKAQNIIVVALLWVFLTSDSYGNGKFVGATTSEEVPLDIRKFHDQTVNEIRSHCSGELKECIHFVEGLQLHLTKTSNRLANEKLDIDLLTKGIVKKVIPDTPSDEKQYLFSYIRKKQLQYYESTEDFGSKNWFDKFRELYSASAAVPRRFLRDRVFPDNKISQPPSSTFGSPDNSPTPSHIVPLESPSTFVHAPSPVVHSPTHKPTSHPKDNTSPQPRGVLASPPGAKKHNADMAAIIGAGCAAGLVFALLLLVCCINRRKSKVGPGNGQTLGKRDDKPLLNISASDVSAGSPVMGQYSNANFKASSSISNDSFVVDYTDSSTANNLATNNSSNGLLPLPPGRDAPPRPPGELEKPEASEAAGLPGPPPPPPPKRAPAPPPPPKAGRPLPKPARPLGGHNQTNSFSSDGSEISGSSDAAKPKLKPFFWEKVMANPDHSMVWNEIKSGSFQFNEEMMESLFGVVQTDKAKSDQDRGSTSSEFATAYIQLIDPKKAQNLAILLKALNVTTEEVCDALLEGNELPAELVENLLRMAPTTDEELKLRLYTGDVAQLGLAERFLKVIIEIPFAFKRMEALLYMTTFQEESVSITESFATLEVACKEVTNSRLFLKLLEAVLKTGNRMNDGTYRGGAMAFKLDTLLKLSDVKGTDGKTTLLHFVVQEIIRSEGLRAARRLRESRSISSVKTEDLVEEPPQDSEDYYRNLGLQVVSGLSNDLVNVRRAALIDGDTLIGSVSNLGKSLMKTKNFLANDMISVEEDSEFCTTVSNFVQDAEAQVSKLLEEEKRIMALVKSTGDYFHGNAGKEEGLRLFGIVRDFLLMVDKACKEISKSIKTPAKTHRKVAFAPSPSKEPHNEASAPSPSNEPHNEDLAPSPAKEASAPSPCHEERQEALLDYHRRLFPAIQEQRPGDDSDYSDDSSSDDDH